MLFDIILVMVSILLWVGDLIQSAEAQADAAGGQGCAERDGGEGESASADAGENTGGVWAMLQ